MRPAADHPLQLVLGFGAWLLWFAVAYGGLGVACSVAPPPAEAGPFTWVNGVLLALTLATAAGLAAAALACRRAGRSAGVEGATRPQRAVFIARSAAWLHGTAALATVVVGLPLAVLPPCA